MARLRRSIELSRSAVRVEIAKASESEDVRNVPVLLMSQSGSQFYQWAGDAGRLGFGVRRVKLSRELHVNQMYCNVENPAETAERRERDGGRSRYTVGLG